MDTDMKLTRQTFELIAEVIDSLYMGHDDWNRKLDQVTEAFADRLAETNDLFDRDRFISAAEGE